ncbi:MAG: GNAT family N-acetyltransferase [Coriobacteriia bacterium]|nr:GNAT family N-acetyltransferase [Coriobacteriia bacterium]
MSGLTTPASRTELAWIAPAARSAHLFDSYEDLLTQWQAAPWRIRTTARGEAVVLGPWREHLDHCAILGLWCANERVPALVSDLEVVARDHGFGRLLGPLVPEGSVGPYLDAGLRVRERVLVMRRDRPRDPGATPPPAAVAIRPGTPPDLEAVRRVDAASFDDFWRYDAAGLARLVRTERLAVAVGDAGVIGYTLAQVRGGEGSLARLAVSPDSRRAGVGRALVTEAVAWMARMGARAVTLSTQEGNAASRALYRSLGFRELPVALVAAISGPLRPAEKE